jgi:UDP-N-acetylglucosamine 2-epimerase
MISNSASESGHVEEKKNAPNAKHGLKSDINEQLTKSISQINFTPTSQQGATLSRPQQGFTNVVSRGQNMAPVENTYHVRA